MSRHQVSYALQRTCDKLRQLVRETDLRERCAHDELDESRSHEAVAARRLASEAARLYTLELMRLSDVRQLSSMQQQLTQALRIRVASAAAPAPHIVHNYVASQQAPVHALDARLPDGNARPRLTAPRCSRAGHPDSGWCSPTELLARPVSLGPHDAVSTDERDDWAGRHACTKSRPASAASQDPGASPAATIAAVHAPAGTDRGSGRPRLPGRPSPRRVFTALDAAVAAATAELQPRRV